MIRAGRDRTAGGKAVMKVGDVMTPHPVAVGLDTPVQQAADRMRDKAIRHLPVVDAAGQVLGIITDRDLRHAAFLPALAEHTGQAIHRVKAPRVRDVMTWSVVTTHADATLVQAALTMFQRRIGSLPVVADGRLVGILTERDVLSALHKHHGIEDDPGLFLW